MNDLRQMPKGAPMPTPIEKVSMPNENTLKNYLTDKETKWYMVSVLKDTANRKPVGPWREYLQFYTANQSGDMDSFSKESRKYIEKMKSDIEDQYLKDQTE